MGSALEKTILPTNLQIGLKNQREMIWAEPQGLLCFQVRLQQEWLLLLGCILIQACPMTKAYTKVKALVINPGKTFILLKNLEIIILIPKQGQWEIFNSRLSCFKN